VTTADAPFPPGASEAEWHHKSDREAGDVNTEMREAVDRNGHSLSRSDFRVRNSQTAAETDDVPHGAWEHHPKSCSRSVNLLRSDSTYI